MTIFADQIVEEFCLHSENSKELEVSTWNSWDIIPIKSFALED
jgi:hypothetical protein